MYALKSASLATLAVSTPDEIVKLDPTLTPPRVDEDAVGNVYLLAPVAIPFNFVTIAAVMNPLAEVVAAEWL